MKSNISGQVMGGGKVGDTALTGAVVGVVVVDWVRMRASFKDNQFSNWEGSGTLLRCSFKDG
jgi:hypothetical protein